MTDLIRVPWTPEQVAALNRFQREGGMHPFTCGHEHPAHPNAILEATPKGWRCFVLDCEYTQDWAHAFMANPDAWPKFPFGERHGPTPEEAAGLGRPACPDPIECGHEAALGQAEAALARVRAARDRIAHSRQADAIYCLDVLDEALGITRQAETASDTGPSVAECRDNDRNWDADREAP